MTLYSIIQPGDRVLVKCYGFLLIWAKTLVKI